MAQRRDEGSYMWRGFSRQQLSVGKASHLFGLPARLLSGVGGKAFFTPGCYHPVTGSAGEQEARKTGPKDE